MPKHKIITGLSILVEDACLQDHALIIEDQRIQAIVPAHEAQGDDVHRFPSDHYLVPGFIDLHIHGIQGADVMDATPQALWRMNEALAAEGVTGFLATTMTASPAKLDAVMQAVAEAARQPQGAGILGIHLEGPFISPQKMGAQALGAQCKPDLALLQAWQDKAQGLIKLVTLAPELPGADAFIQALTSLNIVAAVGHTDATYAETQRAIASGCSHATHLFNAMRGLQQREPGAVTALLMSDKVSAELIADGVHLHPAIIELALRLKGEDKVVLVTDAMRATCLGEGHYDLGGQSVFVNQAQARLADGTLAGSVLRMPEAIKNMMQFTQCSLATAIHLASRNPARVLGLSRCKGSLAVNKDADLVVLNSKLEVVMTLRAGQIIHSTETKIRNMQCGAE